MTHTLHIQDGEQFVKERQFMTDPSNDRWPNDADSISLMHQRIDEYNAHLASLKTYPFIGKANKKHGDPMVEGVDFRFQHQYKTDSVRGAWSNYDPIGEPYLGSNTFPQRIISLSTHKEGKKDHPNGNFSLACTCERKVGYCDGDCPHLKKEEAQEELWATVFKDAVNYALDKDKQSFIDMVKKHFTITRKQTP